MLKLKAPPGKQAVAVETVLAIDAVEFISRLIQFNTVTNTSEIAGFLSRSIASFGIPVGIVEPKPGKANVVWYIEATVPPAERKPGIGLVSHSDVVPAGREISWNYPPFKGAVSGEIFTGTVRGRGAVDDKLSIVAHLLGAVRAMNHCPVRKRDIIGLIVCDEESMGEHGLRHILKDPAFSYLRDVECFFDEGTVGLPGINVLPVATQERTRTLMKVSVQVRGGHSALMGLNAIEALWLFINRAAKATRWVEFHPAMQRFLRGAPPKGALLMGCVLATSGILNKQTLSWLVRFFEPKYQTSFMSTLQCTYFIGGYEWGSLVPDYAEALVDVFLMPGHPQKAWLQKIEDLAQDMGVKIEFIVEPYEASPTTPWEGPAVEALERTIQKLRPGGRVLPLVGPAVTDGGMNLRRNGIKTFGFLPIFPPEIPAFHGPNEEVGIPDIRVAIEFMDVLLRDLVTN